VVQGHACGEGDGSTDDADVCGLRTVCHTRPEVASMCARVGMAACETCKYVRVVVRRLHSRKAHTNIRLIKRTMTHMGEGLSGWCVTIDPPVYKVQDLLDEAALLVGDWVVSSRHKASLDCSMHWQRSRAAGGAAQHSHGTTHSHTGEPAAVHFHPSIQRPVPVTPGQHLLCTSLITWGGGDDRRPVSSPDTPSLDPTPLLCEAKLSQAKLWPCPIPSLPRQAPRHTRPCSRLEGPCTGGRIKALGEWEGLERRRQDKRRGEERGVGAAEGPARVHVTRQGHRRHGQGKRAATQDPPALSTIIFAHLFLVM
jgi:hypothetical protein